ncbi:MAG: enolase C-terminal domain-like protein [Pseudomonadota bacterium]
MKFLRVILPKLTPLPVKSLGTIDGYYAIISAMMITVTVSETKLPLNWGRALAALVLLLSLPGRAVSEQLTEFATAAQLLSAFTGRDASDYKTLFDYSPGRRITEAQVYAVGLDATTARYSGQEAAYFEVNNILRIITADGYEGVSGVDFYSFDNFSDELFLELEAVAALLPALRSLDPIVVSLALSEKYPDLSDAARASVDIALWDLAARRARLPLYQLLGGSRESIDAYASIPFFDTIAEQIEAVEASATQGYDTFKLHIWGEIEADLALVQDIQERFANSGYRFMVDLESVYALEDALRLGAQMDEGLFIWFEAPVNDADFAAYATLKNQLELAIIPAGYNIYSPEYIRKGIATDAWDAARFDATVVGGISPALGLMMIARSSNTPVEIQSWGYALTQAVNLHLMLANEQTEFFEAPMPEAPFMFGLSNAWMFTQGRVYAPGGHGLGLHMDWASLTEADYYKKVTISGRLR